MQAETPITEMDFQQTITSLAKLRGWMVYHTYDSRKGTPGFPDLVLVRGERILYREVKTQIGKLSGSQRAWLDGLEQGGANVAIWRPSDWDEIDAALR